MSAGTVLEAAVAGAKQAEAQGAKAAVFDVRSVKPLDTEAVVALATRGLSVVTVEENALAGGFGSAVLECLADHRVLKPVERLGLPDRFVEHGSQGELRQQVGIDAAAVCAAILRAPPG